MKTLVPVMLLCCLSDTTKAQAPAAFPVDKATRRISYAAVVPAAGASQAELTTRARAWASASASASADKPPIETHEPDTELVTVYGVQPFAYTYEAVASATRPARHYTIKLVLHYTTRLSLREGRYRYEVTDFVFEYPMAKPPSPTKLPAEAELLETRPLNENGSNSIAAVRKSFAEAAAMLQAGLTEKMNKPIISTPEAKQ